MADIYSKSKRSEIMAKISGKETKSEILVRKYLFAQGFRFRKNVKALPGTPDIVLPKFKTIIFIHGCFWHGHSCKSSKLPETRKEFWDKKICHNKARDEKNENELKTLGWNIIVIWQCDLTNVTKKSQRLVRLVSELKDRV
jgi:DNA mismatch endonuclease (patch repair protein)